jgi:ketosteroid isomerase-like protein
MRNRARLGTLVIPLAFLIALVALSPACRKKAQEPAGGAAADAEAADVAAVKAQFDEFVRLYNAGDIDRIVSTFYADHAVQMPPDEPVRKGKEAIRLGYAKTRELNEERIDSSVVETVRVSGDIAFVWGTDVGVTIPKSGGEPAPYRLKWLTVLERSRADGAWKWICEIWNDAGGL